MKLYEVTFKVINRDSLGEEYPVLFKGSPQIVNKRWVRIFIMYDKPIDPNSYHQPHIQEVLSEVMKFQKDNLILDLELDSIMEISDTREAPEILRVWFNKQNEEE